LSSIKQSKALQRKE